MDISNYTDINRASWNTRTSYHLASDFYDLGNFIQGKSSLKEIELNLLGDISGKSILHLQCHFGQDSLSMGRMGAHVTGIDLSDTAIEKAKELATQTGVDARFICSDIYALPQHLNEQFDIVFTSYGVIGWLPDLNEWAAIVSRYLKPGGRFVFVEFHPVVWMFDNNFATIGYNYFKAEPIVETENGTYADPKAPITTENITWNHSLSEVINSLLNNNITINSFDELDYSPYNCFSHAIESEPGKFRIGHLDNKIPMTYAISATKRRTE